MFSQHAFVAFGDDIPGKDAEWHRGMGGGVYFAESIVITRIGPLVIIGRLHKADLKDAELDTWEGSRILPSGGTLPHIRKNQPNELLTKDFARFLNKLESTLVNQATGLPEP